MFNAPSYSGNTVTPCLNGFIQEGEQMFNRRSAPLFNGFRVINDHLEERSKLESYIKGLAQEPLQDPKITPCPECLFAKWLNKPECQGLSDIELHCQICNTCAEFHSAASQAVLLMSAGKVDLAKEAIKDGGIYAKLSAKLQRKLKLLHFQLDAVAA